MQSVSLAQAQALYAAADAAHNFDHIQRVYHLAVHIAQAEGADVVIVGAAALLHDIPTSHPRAEHHLRSAEAAAEWLQSRGWGAEVAQAVADCIRTHRFRQPEGGPKNREAQCLFDADKLDAIGAIGVARAIAYAVTHHQPLYHPLSQSFYEHGQLAPNEPHSAYHEYWVKLRHLPSRLHTVTARQLAKQRSILMQAYFEQLAAEMEAPTP